MVAKKLLPGVYQFDTIAFSYLLVDDAFLVDGGFSLNPAKILDGLRAVGYQPTDVKELVATHCHRDHIGGFAALREKTGAQIVAHATEVPFVEGRQFLPNRGAMTRLLRRFIRSPPLHVDRAVHEGDRVGSFRVLDTPGHTPGHIVLWDENRSLVIAGDAVRVTRTHAGPSQPRFNVDQAQAVQSFRRIASLEFENLVAGHDDVVLGGASRVLRERAG